MVDFADELSMERAPALLTGRITRTAMSFLVCVVLLAIPFEAAAYADPLVTGTIPLRGGGMLLILIGLRTFRLTAVEAGQLFLAQGLLTMVCWAVLLEVNAHEATMEAIAYGTILPVCTLLIAPRHSRRAWMAFVVGLVLLAATIRLLPSDISLLAQVYVVLLIHAAALTTLDAHANKAEIAGARADIDSLTGLANRGVGIREMSAIVCRNSNAAAAEPGSAATDAPIPASLVLLDLDHFKQLNDTLGHLAGDDALRRVANVLMTRAGADDIVCRWGGEEFVIVLPEADEADAVATAELIRVRLAEAGVTGSFGVAQLDVGDTVTTWVRRADDAMYVAKREGRDRVCVAAGIAT